SVSRRKDPRMYRIPLFHWLRIVWPNWLLTTGVLYAVVEGVAAALEWFWGGPWPFPEYRPGAVVLWPAAAMDGLHRVGTFHPLGTDYGRWLATTPWTSRKPLPLGPVHLAGQDALLLLLVLAATWPFGELTGAVALQIFFVTYLLAFAVDLAAADE